MAGINGRLITRDSNPHGTVQARTHSNSTAGPVRMAPPASTRISARMKRAGNIVHPWISGTVQAAASPLLSIGVYADWRLGMEAFGRMQRQPLRRTFHAKNKVAANIIPFFQNYVHGIKWHAPAPCPYPLAGMSMPCVPSTTRHSKLNTA